MQRSFNPDKRSIFALSEDEHCNAYSEQEEEEDQVKGQQDPAEQTAKADELVVVEREEDVGGSLTSKQPPKTGRVVTKSVAKGSSKRAQAKKSFVICGGNAAPL